MDDFNLIVALLGALTLGLGLLSKRLQQSILPETVLAFFFGILLGPGMLGLIDLSDYGNRALILEKLARLTLGIGLVSVALRIPKTYPRENWRSMVVLIGLGMLLMWVTSTALVYFILGLPFWMAALIGAIITPTDPIAASPIVTGSTAEQNLPERIRHALSFESGANDGLSYLFIFLPFLILTRSVEEAVSHWLIHTLLWEIGVATVFGLVLGAVTGKLLLKAEEHDFIHEKWRLVYTVALALLAVGVGRIIGSDELLLVFASGAAFTQVVSQDERKHEESGQEAINRFFAVPIFVVFGTALPWQGWQELGMSGVLLALAVLLFRRIPVLLLLLPLLSNLKRLPDALFLGWFGPIAVAAIYYANLMEHRLNEPLIWTVTSLVVAVSVVVHGMSAVPLTRLYGRKTEQQD
ncbi:MAG: cation:proton antiporter [Anaerolineae bacterium]